jgi:hypothetical protein
MKFSYRILPEQRLNILRFSGSVSVADVTRHIQQFWADSEYNPEYNGIVDLEGVTTRAKVEDLKALLDFLENQKTGTGWWAAIFTEPKPTALALIFKATFAGTFKLEIVSSWQAACKFLQIDLPEDTVAELG